ncbi:hypothetical protein [Bordetella sp. 15P40C-2]|uniref:hypothetical protein n=1 Tax=Bordetella sp. 15P40C-2 TaxID=2572246 RepID=UPI001320B68A|nr:hypothetical protein [Bordetella sp. 15P40C-2]MVW72873.1 hypothetical protein [Bordetella sp. 15P40C-2]
MKCIYKIFLASSVYLSLAGCDTVQDYKPYTKNGQEYVYGDPVVARGVLEEVRVTEKNGTVHNISKGAGDMVGDAGIGGAVAANIGGMSSLQGGMALGGIGAILDIVSALNAPRVEYMVRRDGEGDLVNVPVAVDYVKRITDYHCVDLGDRVRVLKVGRRLTLVNENYQLLRLSDFQPTCAEQKASFSASIEQNEAR